MRQLQIDHIHNDGKAHRAADAAARTIYAWLRRHDYPPGFQVLCGRCNIDKYQQLLRQRSRHPD